MVGRAPLLYSINPTGKAILGGKNGVGEADAERYKAISSEKWEIHRFSKTERGFCSEFADGDLNEYLGGATFTPVGMEYENCGL